MPLLNARSAAGAPTDVHSVTVADDVHVDLALVWRATDDDPALAAGGFAAPVSSMTGGAS